MGDFVGLSTIKIVFILIAYFAFLLFYLATFWKIFEKANQPGWAIFIPIYNIICFLEIAGKPWWWIILYCIPILNLFIAIIVIVAFAKKFDKDVDFSIGLILLGFVFYPILAYDKRVIYNSK